MGLDDRRNGCQSLGFLGTNPCALRNLLRGPGLFFGRIGRCANHHLGFAVWHLLSDLAYLASSDPGSPKILLRARDWTLRKEPSSWLGTQFDSLFSPLTTEFAARVITESGVIRRQNNRRAGEAAAIRGTARVNTTRFHSFASQQCSSGALAYSGSLASVPSPACPRPPLHRAPPPECGISGRYGSRISICNALSNRPRHRARRA